MIKKKIKLELCELSEEEQELCELSEEEYRLVVGGATVKTDIELLQESALEYGIELSSEEAGLTILGWSPWIDIGGRITSVGSVRYPRF